MQNRFSKRGKTVITLVGLLRFVIIDLSGPSVPQELYATIRHYKVPFVPIIEEGKKPYSMFIDFLEENHVLKPIVKFTSKEQLIELIPTRVIEPAEEKIKNPTLNIHEPQEMAHTWRMKNQTSKICYC